MVLLLDFNQLVYGARTVAFLLSTANVLIFEMLIQPAFTAFASCHRICKVSPQMNANKRKSKSAKNAKDAKDNSDRSPDGTKWNPGTVYDEYHHVLI